MTMKIELSPAAVREFKKFTAREKEDIIIKIEKLAENPYPEGCKRLSGVSSKIKKKLNIESIYRIRVGNYRVLYSVKESEIVVYILRIGDRKEIYQFIKSKQV